ncbi:ATPase family associated with various cellular activities (AAA) [Carpediemonas membranifera]|uniref:ATPase family associated with various cellular activities (AAA) n=1 Tax=Carpediemonas membranifera TaxID=201153 RepID=A0A8J6DY71_9EUKA|nr:ATPase family associated with various cellular activities (AAA) [Carpediemonas membranifera]|eukprot:KAG9391659.1 ATPase family associated with various cellular activities (AAA) [Carpediemonas membranifera]
MLYRPCDVLELILRSPIADSKQRELFIERVRVNLSLKAISREGEVIFPSSSKKYTYRVKDGSTGSNEQFYIHSATNIRLVVNKPEPVSFSSQQSLPVHTMAFAETCNDDKLLESLASLRFENDDDETYQQIKASTHGFVGADLLALVQKAAVHATKNGSTTMTAADLRACKPAIQPSGLRSLVVEVPKTTFDDIGGYDSIKLEMKNRIKIMLDSKLRARYGLSPSRGILFYGPPGCGKCLAKGTPVLMYDGTFVHAEEVVPGARLMGDDNSPRTVLSVSTGREEMATVRRAGSDGGQDLFTCNMSHVLTLVAIPLPAIRDGVFTAMWRCAQFNTDGTVSSVTVVSHGGFDTEEKALSYAVRMESSPDAIESGTVVDMDVRTFMALPEHLRASFHGISAPAMDFEGSTPDSQLPVDPYHLGLWLGAGSVQRGVAPILCSNPDVIAHVEALGATADTQGMLSLAGHDALMTLITDHALWPEKSIPGLYMRSSRTARRSLLAGLCDAAGIDSDSTGLHLHCPPLLLADALNVARSLGIGVSKAGADHSILCGSGVADLPTRSCRPHRQDSSDARSFPISVVVMPEDAYYGFTLDGNSRFIVGHAMTVTHNTLFAKALAHEAGMNFITIRSSDVFSMYVGESEASVRAIFRTARAHSPCLLFMDEVDAIVPNRNQKDSHETITTQMLVELENAGNGMIVVAATNRPDQLDPSLIRPGRIDQRILVDTPGADERLSILQVTLKGVPCDNTVPDAVARVAERTIGLTGAEVVALSERARGLALAGSDDPVLSSTHIDMAMREALLKPLTVTAEMEALYSRFGDSE